jgi:hypothetical protein
MARDVTALARRFRTDVNTGTEGAPTWLQLMGVMELTPPKIDSTIQKSSDYEDGGWAGNQRTEVGWKLEATVRRKQSPTGAYDPAQEYLRARKSGCGAAGNAQIRVYERAGGAGTEAYMGTGVVEWEDTNSKTEDLAFAKITITGDGTLVDIANPAG